MEKKLGIFLHDSIATKIKKKRSLASKPHLEFSDLENASEVFKIFLVGSRLEFWSR